MLIIGVHHLINVHHLWHFLWKLDLSIDCYHHFSADCWFDKLFYGCLYKLCVTGFLENNVNLNLIIKSVGLGILLELYFICLNPLITQFSIFVKSILVYLHAKITVKTFLFFILNWPVHNILPFWFTILNWMVFKEFQRLLLDRHHTMIFQFIRL